MANEYLTTQEVAKILRTHVHTVRRMIKAGRIKATKLGGSGQAHYRVSKDELDRILGR